VGGISHKKNPSMMLQIFKKLIDIDSDYRLHIAGAYQETRYEIYFNHMIKVLNLTGKVVMYGNVADMDNFYEDKDFILNTSVHEGHCVSVIEAMARGITPVVHNYYGADKQYETWMLFDDVIEACFRIADDEPDQHKYRQYVIDHNWTLDSQVNSFKNIINEVYLG